MGKWDAWHQLENAQAQADAEGIGPRPPADVPADPEAASAVVEAERIVWPHPIPPTRPGGPPPTNADGSQRIGWWRGGEWVDSPKPEPLPPLQAVRLYLRALRDALKADVEEQEKPPWKS